jgi:hypothetical protein
MSGVADRCLLVEGDVAGASFFKSTLLWRLGKDGVMGEIGFMVVVSLNIDHSSYADTTPCAYRIRTSEPKSETC